MTFGATLGKHLMMAASANMFYVAIDFKNKTCMEVAASNINIKINQLFSWCPRDHCTAENLRGLDTNLLLNKV